jgi:chaperonin GroEL (HSP60 family)
MILAGEVLSVAKQFIEDELHPTQIIAAYRHALDDALDILRNQVSVPVDVNNDEEMHCFCSVVDDDAEGFLSSVNMPLLGFFRPSWCGLI